MSNFLLPYPFFLGIPWRATRWEYDCTPVQGGEVRASQEFDGMNRSIRFSGPEPY